MSLPISPTTKTTDAVIIYRSEEASPKKEIVIEQSDDVTEKDILHAANFGVIAGLGRHLKKSPKKQAEAALSIMEAIHARGYREKVWMFVCGSGWEMCRALKNPVGKAEFAIRVGKMLDGEERSEWCSFAAGLLSEKDVCEVCSKGAMETLALMFAEANDLKQTLRWLGAANAEREIYNESAYEFFLQGAFNEGLRVIEEAPGDFAYNPKDFTELVAYGLTNSEILKDPTYREAILAFQDDWKQETIILKALCYFHHTQQAIDLAEQMALHKESISIYPLLLLSECIQKSPEREVYLERLITAAVELDGRERKITGWGPLYDAVTSKHLSVQESLRICQEITNVDDLRNIRANALWERACGISNKLEMNGEDFRNLQTILKAMRGHLAQSPFNGDQGHPPFWVKVIRHQIQYEFVEDIEQTGAMWEAWRKTRGLDWENRPCNTGDIWFLSYWGLFQIVTGKKEEGLKCLAESHDIQQEDMEYYNGHTPDHFLHLLMDASKHFLWSPMSTLEPRDKTFLKQLSNSYYSDVDQVRLLLMQTEPPLAAGAAH